MNMTQTAVASTFSLQVEQIDGFEDPGGAHRSPAR
jgi:hypothetical protein